MAEGAEREVATTAEGVEDSTLGARGKGNIWTVECGDGRVNGVVFGSVGTSGLEGECALAGCGTELVDGEALVNLRGAVEAVEGCGREDERVCLALLPFAQASVDVATDLDETKVGTKGEEHGFAAR